MKIILVLLLFPFYIRASGLPINKVREYEVSAVFGFGVQYIHSTPKKTPDAYNIVWDKHFVKGTSISIGRYVDRKNSIFLDLGYSYDYSLGYSVASNNSNLGVGVDAGTDAYTLWHATLNIKQDVLTMGRFTGSPFCGLGLELYLDNRYFKFEQQDPHINPNVNYTYTHQPSEITRKPIFLLNAGVDVAYKMKYCNAIFARITGKYSFRPFLIDRVNVVGSSAPFDITSEMTGTNVILSIGVKHTFSVKRR